MSPRAEYYRRRRRQLRKLRRCVRCGALPKAKGHCLCSLCLEEKKLKRADDSTGQERARIEKRLQKIDAIRAALLGRIS